MAHEPPFQRDPGAISHAADVTSGLRNFDNLQYGRDDTSLKLHRSLVYKHAAPCENYPDNSEMAAMRVVDEIFESNRNWAARIKEVDPEFFTKLSQQQNPEYLWIGCSDSRVPANEIVGMLPGEIFVHRNIANLVIHTDLNCLSVIQYAVEVLKVKHIIVCGHYGCGGIKAAMDDVDHGLIDNWLRNIQDTYLYHQSKLDAVEDLRERQDLLCELNVVGQVANVCRTNIVRNAWKSGQELAVHGWIYSIEDGILKDLNVCITGPD